MDNSQFANLSPKNLEKIQKVLEITIDAIIIKGVNRLEPTKILISRFSRENIDYEDVIAILNKVNIGSYIFHFPSEEYKRELWFYEQNTIKDPLLKPKLPFGLIEQDLSNYVILQVTDKNVVEKLKQYKERVDEAVKVQKKIVISKPTEEWDKNTGIWKITIPKEKPIVIKLGKKGTETNEAFSLLHSMKNKDVETSKIREILAKVFNKSPQKVNVGVSIAKLRTWINKTLGQEHKNLVIIYPCDRQTKTYKLGLNL
jgi:hypothetical protein